MTLILEVIKEFVVVLDHLDVASQTAVVATSVLVAMYLFFTINVFRAWNRDDDS